MRKISRNIVRLPAYRFKGDPEGRVICCWRLSVWDRLRLLFTGHIWHHVLTFNSALQPQLLSVSNPFVPELISGEERA